MLGKINITILLLFFSCSHLYAMNTLAQQSQDIKKNIFSALISGNIDEDIKNTIALGSVNKNFNTYLHDKEFVGSLILLMKRLNGVTFEFPIYKKFKTPTTTAWLKDCLQKDEELKRSLENGLIRNSKHAPSPDFVQQGNNRMRDCECILQLGISPNIRDDLTKKTLLVNAIESNNKPFACLLLKFNPEFNQLSPLLIQPFQQCMLPALFFAIHQSSNMVKLLLQHGAPVNTQTEKGETALIFAAHLGKYKAVQYLIESGADVNVQDKESFTALHLAALDGYSRIIKFLLNHGAKPDVQDGDGETALIMAAKFNRKKSIEFLVAADADVSIKGNDGQTALDKTDNSTIRELLLAAEVQQKKY